MFHTSQTIGVSSPWLSLLSPRYFILFDVIFKQDCSLLSLFDSLLLMYRKAAYLCISILHPSTLLNSLISSNSFGVDTLEFPIYSYPIIEIVNFTSSLPFFFPRVTAVASSTI